MCNHHKREIMKKQPICREDILLALERFYDQGGEIEVLTPQKLEATSYHKFDNLLDEAELLDEVSQLPKDLDFALKNSLSLNPFMGSQLKY